MKLLTLGPICLLMAHPAWAEGPGLPAPRPARVAKPLPWGGWAPAPLPGVRSWGPLTLKAEGGCRHFAVSGPALAADGPGAGPSASLRSLEPGRHGLPSEPRSPQGTRGGHLRVSTWTPTLEAALPGGADRLAVSASLTQGHLALHDGRERPLVGSQTWRGSWTRVLGPGGGWRPASLGVICQGGRATGWEAGPATPLPAAWLASASLGFGAWSLSLEGGGGQETSGAAGTGRLVLAAALRRAW